MLAGQEGRVPVLRPVRREATMIREHHERRQILIHAAEPVADPRTHAGKTGQLKSRRLQVRGLTVYARLAHQIVNKRHVVHDLAELGHRLAQHLAGLTIRLERPDRFHPRPEPVLKRLHVFAKVALLPVALHELRLVVEQVDVAGRAAHEHLDDALGPRLEVRLARTQTRPRGTRNRAQQTFATQ